MFRNRQSSQKPPDELFEHFRQSFPQVNSTVGEARATINALQDITQTRPRLGLHEDADPTPKAPKEPFRFTPSLLDSNPNTYATFASQPSGYYNVTTGGPQGAFASTVHHEMPTPMLGLSVDTPLGNVNNTALPYQNIHDGNVQNYHLPVQVDQFGGYQPFMPGFMPSQFMVTDFQAPSSPRGSPMQIGTMDEIDVDQMEYKPHVDDTVMEHYAGSQLEKFRYHVTLNAPTAMIKHHDEIPVTYLNKGQSYSVTVLDTQPPAMSTIGIRYRTFVRISFQDEGQREKAAFCWQLWKEGRGLNEAHQRGGELQAVEFVEPQPSDEEKKKTRVEVEKASFDGFSVIWTPATNSTPEAVINVRFNFLSTDFSHSKGVKGIPVRLCAKTEVLSAGSPVTPEEKSEVCYCKVKLFRDHGAERKLANDILHVKKTIDKLRQQLHMANDPDPGHGGKKRKDSLKINGAIVDSKPGRIQKHKRTWSVSSSASLSGIGKGAVEDDINSKLSMMQDMFTSTRPVSVLYLRGDELDHPDLHPIVLPDGPMQEVMEGSWSRRPSAISIDTSGPSSSLVSPTPSSASLPSQKAISPDHPDWAMYQAGNNAQHNNLDSGQAVKVKIGTEGGMVSGWIEAIGVDPQYVPPAMQLPKPVACIYVLPLTHEVPADAQYYRAIYLLERTSACLTASLALKCGIDASCIVRLSRQTATGINILIDDDVVREIPEGQDMKLQVQEFMAQTLSPPQSEWSPDLLPGEEGKPTLMKGWEVRLFY